MSITVNFKILFNYTGSENTFTVTYENKDYCSALRHIGNSNVERLQLDKFLQKWTAKVLKVLSEKVYNSSNDQNTKTYSTAVANCLITDNGGITMLSASKLSTEGIRSAPLQIRKNNLSLKERNSIN